MCLNKCPSNPNNYHFKIGVVKTEGSYYKRPVLMTPSAVGGFLFKIAYTNTSRQATGWTTIEATNPVHDTLEIDWIEVKTNLLSTPIATYSPTPTPTVTQ